jgi:hypothetical protein
MSLQVICRGSGSVQQRGENTSSFELLPQERFEQSPADDEQPTMQFRRFRNLLALLT